MFARRRTASASALKAEPNGKDSLTSTAAAREADATLSRLNGLASAADEARADLTANLREAAEALRHAVWDWASVVRLQACR